MVSNKHGKDVICTFPVDLECQISIGIGKELLACEGSACYRACISRYSYEIAN